MGCCSLFVLLLFAALPLSLSHSLNPYLPLSLSHSLASLVLSLEVFRWHLSWRSFRVFRLFPKFLLFASFCIFYVKMKWNCFCAASRNSSEPRELSTENWEKLIARSQPTTVATQPARSTDRQFWIWRSSRSPRWRTLNKTHILCRWKQERKNKIKSANKTKQNKIINVQTYSKYLILNTKYCMVYILFVQEYIYL